MKHERGRLAQLLELHPRIEVEVIVPAPPPWPHRQAANPRACPNVLRTYKQSLVDDSLPSPLLSTHLLCATTLTLTFH